MEYDWASLLTQWNRELLDCEAITERLPPEVVRSGWLGFPPATEEQIRQTECRLGVSLPPSSRQFLQFTNGWRSTGFFIEAICSAETVDWYRVRHQEAIDAWLLGVHSMGPPIEVPDEEYFVYGDEQDSSTFRDDELPTTLQVSEVSGTDVYLLNPQVVFPDGEWEAWFHASWVAGAQRYRSFWALLQAEHESFLRLREDRPG